MTWMLDIYFLVFISAILVIWVLEEVKSAD
jgi:hypothetical protein